MKHAGLLVAIVLTAALIGLGSMFFLVPRSQQTPVAQAPTVDDVRRVLGDAVGAASDAIQVEVEGARVRLGGRAPSGDVRDRALRAVRELPGVAEVDNRISVGPTTGRLPAGPWRA